MGAGVPQADVSVVATGEEVGFPGVDSQTPQLICVTLGRSRECALYHVQSNQDQSLCIYTINLFHRLL